MNSLVVLPQELHGSQAIIIGPRARYLLEFHDLKVGIKMRGTLLGGLRGQIEVASLGEEEIRLNCIFDQEPPSRFQTTLIIAIPRPQTVKKIVQFAATAGITNLFFVKAARSDKSYLQSKSLLPENIQTEMIKGLEQTYDCLPPTVSVFNNLYGLFEKSAALQADLKFILAPGAHAGLSERRALGHSLILALGPELGWAQTEVELFKERGFELVDLGERIYRLEFALALALGQIGRY